MKKIITYTLLIIVIIIVVFYAGVYFMLKKDGVIPTQTKEGNILIEKTYLGSTVKNTGNYSYNEIFKSIKENAGFHVYYPAYSPKEVSLKKDTIFWGTEDKENIYASFSLGDMSNPTLDLPWISIYQNFTPGKTKNFVLKKLENLESKKQILINKNYGYSGSSGKFNHVIFSTKDGVDIALWSKFYNIDTLVKVAKSMK